ncbi:hypothetical protein [Staphylococcus rostri]|uniref:hypothetical protein n=1 Tax=Staphylococcus rostri TaxID=522262 RepID=UPI0034A09414
MSKDLVISAFEKACAIQVPRQGLIHHSDRESHYAPKEYQTLLCEKDIQISMSRFICFIKKELTYHCDYKIRNETMFNILEYILTF